MQDADNQIDRNDYCFDIKQSFGSDGNYLSLIKQGNVRIEAQLSKALSRATTCVVYAEFPG